MKIIIKELVPVEFMSFNCFDPYIGVFQCIGLLIICTQIIVYLVIIITVKQINEELSICLPKIAYL